MDDWENLEPDPAFDYAETQDAFWPVETSKNDAADLVAKPSGLDHAPSDGTGNKQEAVAMPIDDGTTDSLALRETLGARSAPDSEPKEAATSPEDEGGAAERKADASSRKDADAHVCRICFSGEGDDDDDEDLGRLISPCLCKGTVAKVHVACLQAWRTASKGRTSFFQCDQCKYRYRIRRAKIAGLAENNFALAGLAAFFFFILVTVNGYIGNWLLGQSSSPDSVISSLFFGEPDYSSYSGWSSHRDGLFPFEAIGSAVDFASRVAEELQEGNGVQAALTGAQRDGSSYRILGKRSRKTRQRSKTQELALRFRRAVEHVLLGISMTSIGSFLWMLISLPLLPFHPMRTGLFRTVRSTRDSRGQITPMGTVLLALFLLVGFLKSLHICWRLTRKVSHVILTRAENGILEVRS